MSNEPPALFTFDVFGTLVDWRSGLGLADALFDRVIDRQAELEEARPFRSYTEIVAQSLVDVTRMNALQAAAIGAEAGRWPLYPDSRAALARLRKTARCAALTNSDKAHGGQVREQLGELDGWICAEELRLYKPDPGFWLEAGKRLGVRPGPSWWHVSAYGDYDLATARTLGLTCVFVRRPHARPGPADVVVEDLGELAERVNARRR